MPNGDDKAFDAMNVVTATDEVDLTEDGEKSAWFPTGEFLGMKIPKGTSTIVEGLAFLAIGSPGPKVVKAVTNQIKKQAASLSPEMQKVAVGKASDYFKKTESTVRKLSGDVRIRDRAVAEISSKDKALREFSRQFQTQLSQPRTALRNISQRPALRNILQRRKSFADLPIKSDVTRVLDKSKKYQDYLRDFKYKEFEIARKSSVGFAPAFEAIGKFSIPAILDEIEKE